MTSQGEGPESALRGQVTGWLSRAYELRKFRRPGKGAVPDEVHGSLIALRAVLDEFEGLVINLDLVRKSAVSGQREAEERAQDAWDALAEAHHSAVVRREYEGTEERYARWRLQTLPLLQEARAARRRAEFTLSAYDAADRMYWGLKDVRRELLASLEELQWETAMER